MLKLSIRRLLDLSASILCALLLLGNLIVWNSNASLAAAAEEARASNNSTPDALKPISTKKNCALILPSSTTEHKRNILQNVAFAL